MHAVKQGDRVGRPDVFPRHDYASPLVSTSWIGVCHLSIGRHYYIGCASAATVGQDRCPVPIPIQMSESPSSHQFLGSSHASLYPRAQLSGDGTSPRTIILRFDGDSLEWNKYGCDIWRRSCIYTHRGHIYIIFDDNHRLHRNHDCHLEWHGRL